MQNSWYWKYLAISIYQVITVTPCSVEHPKIKWGQSYLLRVIFPDIWFETGECIYRNWVGAIPQGTIHILCKHFWGHLAHPPLPFGAYIIYEWSPMNLWSVGPAMKICSKFGIFGKPTTTTNAPYHHLVDDGWVILQICKSARKNIFLSQIPIQQSKKEP